MFAAQLAELKPGLRARDRRDVVRMRAQIEAQLAGPCLDGAAEEAAPEPLLPVATIVRDPVRAAPVVPVAPQPLPRVDLTPSPSVRRPLRIVGGAALGLGLGLGAGMIAALVRGASLHERTTTVSDTYKGQLIPEPENGQFELDRVRGQRADNAALGLGIAGGLLAVVGVSLLVVDHGRAPRRVAIGPILPTAGLRLALEF